MAHSVICKYCNERFDRDKEAYAAISARRYAHASCALREYSIHPVGEKPQIIDPTNFVTCIYCKKTFDKTKENFKLFTNGKYAHKTCYDLEQSRELTDQEKLDQYIMKLYQCDFVNPRIQKQIKKYVVDYGYTYSGILKALKYWYEIKKHPVEEKYKSTIGIVEQVYQSAYNYYYAIWEAQQKQAYIVDAASLEEYIPKIIEITIPVPKTEIKKRSLFTFLDEEEITNGN